MQRPYLPYFNQNVEKFLRNGIRGLQVKGLETKPLQDIIALPHHNGNHCQLLTDN
ncbi:hypothetical protein [Dapis sp. BLCC M172]|uniref:hypothetical protein n=1 Tax=Dapis sp. BLCC M172 TaxID=2975281 RepID=UPI003CEDE5ED